MPEIAEGAANFVRVSFALGGDSSKVFVAEATRDCQTYLASKAIKRNEDPSWVPRQDPSLEEQPDRFMRRWPYEINNDLELVILHRAVSATLRNHPHKTQAIVSRLTRPSPYSGRIPLQRSIVQLAEQPSQDGQAQFNGRRIYFGSVEDITESDKSAQRVLGLILLAGDPSTELVDAVHHVAVKRLQRKSRWLAKRGDPQGEKCVPLVTLDETVSEYDRRTLLKALNLRLTPDTPFMVQGLNVYSQKAA